MSAYFEPMLERLTQLENNFSLFLSCDRDIKPYSSPDEALQAPSRFSRPVTAKISDPIVVPTLPNRDNSMPFWRSRITTLYIEWAKSFTAFQLLPYKDKAALIAHHANSYLIMREVFLVLKWRGKQASPPTECSNIAPSSTRDTPMTTTALADKSCPRHMAEHSSLASEHQPAQPEQKRRRESASEQRTMMPSSSFSDDDIRHGLFSLDQLRSDKDSGWTADAIDSMIGMFRRLNLSTTEFATLQAIMFFDPDAEELNAASQASVRAEQKTLVNALYRHISSNYNASDAAQRYQSILLQIPNILSSSPYNMAFYSALNGISDGVQKMNIGSRNSAFEQRGFNRREDFDFDVYSPRDNDQRRASRNEAEQDLESLTGLPSSRQNASTEQSAHSYRNRNQPFVEGGRYQSVRPQADDEFIPSRIAVRDAPLYQTTNAAGGGGGGRPDERKRKPLRKERFVPREKQPFELYDEDEQIRPGTHFKKLMNDAVFVTGVSEEEGSIYVESFAACGFSPEIMKNLQMKKYQDPTPIQKYVIPLILQKKGDILGRAQTGSGKTAAFLLPIIQKIQRYKAHGQPVVRGSPFALIIGVTGELTRQLYDDARAFANQTGVSVQYNIGGVNMRNVLNGLKYSDCDIMVTTIGRAKHFIEDNALKLDQMRYLVLDEADKVLNNIEFMTNLNFILRSGMHSNYRIFLFSATFDNEVQRVAYDNQLIRDKTYFVSVGDENRVVDTVQQEFVMVEQHAKQDLLIEMLRARSVAEPIPGNKYILYPENSIVFVAKKRQSDRVALALAQAGFNAISINADRTCRQRVDAIEKFSKNLYQVLVATDVASRGMNFPRIKYVVNYDLPNVEDTTYIHRVGRAGRAGNEGYAMSFFDPYADEDLKHANFYMKTLLSVKQKVPLFLVDIVEKKKRCCEQMRRLHGLVYDEPENAWN